jgi:hypothetical protein
VFKLSDFPSIPPKFGLLKAEISATFPFMKGYNHITLACPLLLAGCFSLVGNDAIVDVQPAHSEAAFQELQIESQSSSPPLFRQNAKDIPTADTNVTFSERDNRVLIAIGYGDLSKGILNCRRVADTAARAELAKLIRVRISEHSIDRVGERTGQDFTQVVEITREENADEVLQGVQITERTVNRSEGTCSSRAILPKDFLVPTDMRVDIDQR